MVCSHWMTTGDDKMKGEGDGGSANGTSSPGVFLGVEIRRVAQVECRQRYHPSCTVSL